jgi:hypothetical protein
MFTPRGSTSGILPALNKPQGLPTHLHQPLLRQPTQPVPTTYNHEAAVPDWMPALDLNLDTQPQHLDQRYVLLANDEKSEALSDTSVTNLTTEEQEHLAHHILRDLTDNLKPLSGAEYLIVIPAILFALGACATSKDFGDKFAEGLESLLTSFKASSEATKTGVAWGIAAANVCAQFSLSTNSVITVLTRLLRSRQRSADAKLDPALAGANETASKYDKPLTKREIAYLTAIPLSAAATYKMGFDTLTGKYGQAPGIGHGVGALRYGSASLINFNFTYDQIYRWRGDNDNLAVINLLKTSKKRLNNLADSASNPLLFIQALNQNNLLKQLNGKNPNPVENNTSKKQIEAMVDELFQSTPFVEAIGADGETPRCTKSDVVQWVSMILGGLVSLTNFKAGTRVPELFGLPVAKDLVDFFSNIAADWTLGVAALGFVFGIPSWFVNLIINARSCMNFANGIAGVIKDINTNGTDALKKYWSADGALVATLFITSLGYGAGNGGSGYKYPPLNMIPIPIINLLLSSVVFTALGNLSQQGAVAKLRDKLDDALLQRAINTENLEDFYQTLTSAEQNTLRRLLVNNINLAFDSQIASYNKLQDGAVNGMFSEELRHNLESRYGTDLTSIVIQTPSPAPSTSAASDLVDIRVDPMTTIEEKSRLTNIRIDSMAPLKAQTPPLPPRPATSQNDTIRSRTPGSAYTPLNGSPLMTASSPTMFHSGSPSNPINIRRKHNPATHHHSSILGTETGLDGFSTNLMAPTRSPNTISPGGLHSQPHSPHTPRLYSTTPAHQTDNSTITTTNTYQSPKYGSSQ